MDDSGESLMLAAAQPSNPGQPELHFAGDLTLPVALGLGAVFAGLSWWLYRRDLRGRAGWMLWVLPLLRVLAVLLLMGTMTGPVLVTRTPVGTTTRVMVFTDASASMTVADEQMDTDRKLRIMEQLGWLEADPDRNATDPAVVAALKRFDTTPRWQRLQQALLSGDESVFEQLADEHDTDLAALQENDRRLVWHPEVLNAEGEKVRVPASLGVEQTITNNFITDLVTGVDKHVIADAEEAAGINLGLPSSTQKFVILFSDGQHNAEPRARDFARRLGNRGVEMHIVGMGTTRMPRDLAILKVAAPGKVFPNTIVSGEVVISDGMPPGKPFRMIIEHNGRTLVEQDLVTTEAGRRNIPFRFPIESIVEEQKQLQNNDLQYSNLPLEFNVRLTPVEGEIDEENNQSVLRVNVVTEEFKMLMVDGRPRWEQRYLYALFDRDERWKVRSVVADSSGRQGLGPRGNGPGQFPATREALFAHQLIIIGDVAPQMFHPEELQWIRDFVQFNGGGVIFIDGHMERLVNFRESPIGPLFPVRWTGASDFRSLDLKLRPLSEQPAVQLMSDPAANVDVWNGLMGPRRVSLVNKLEGAEIILEVVEGNRRAPAMVFRRYGAGRVLYSCIDETWRWRYEVADRHHERFWKQAAKWIMEEPFAVSDRFVKLDSGEPSYEVKEQVRIRMRLRDPAAMERLRQADLKPAVMIMRNGEPLMRLPLEPDFNSAMYRGITPSLDGGEYEVVPIVPGVPQDLLKARTKFTVASIPTGEMGVLHCNDKLLRLMAADSGGKYYAEEDLAQLVENLRPHSTSGEIIDERKLWQSFWVFLPLIVLLTLEWTLRKAAGLL
ncbi:MAG: hypothetical protein CMO74_09905 [Verrucomicrobiales bacterium]|nr:hypothetical protein [Verrucomicrobiales bacterium]|tara:strand:- start:5529 stop:8036 length:2508 start_codon:yes stop_codon:yes gene_type:complete